MIPQKEINSLYIDFKNFCERFSLPVEKTVRQKRFLSLKEVESEVIKCRKCRLYQNRKNTVFGGGDPDTSIVIIGEAPGAVEDQTGLPFTGRSGQLLTRMLKSIDLVRNDVFITNIIKCRPPGNRNPKSDEISACENYLYRQIEIIKPEFLLILGRPAAHTLLQTELPLSRIRGQWHQVRGIPAIVTYHPAALLRNNPLKRDTWQDLQMFQKRLKQV